MRNVVFLKTLLEVPYEPSEESVSEIIVLPPGSVELYGYDPLLMDGKAAKAMIAGFKDQGVQVPIDYEHASVKRAERGQAAPAAGWVTDLSWDEERGLIARVEWTVEASRYIETGEYKYLSPVLVIDMKTSRPVQLHSLALTNKPRIKDQPELLAASVELRDSLEIGSQKENSEMTTVKEKGGAPPSWIKRTQGGLKKVALAETLPGVEVDEEVLPPEQVTELQETGEVLFALKELLMALGVEIAEDADSAAILMAVGEFLSKLHEELAATPDATPPEEIAAEVAAASAADEDEAKVAASTTVPANGVLSQPAFMTNLCDRLKLKRGTDPKLILSTVQGLQGHIGYVNADVHNQMAERLEKLELVNRAEQVDSLLQVQLAQHRLNPYDTKQISWAKGFAATDPEGFKKIMAGAPVICPVGQEISPEPESHAGKSKRQQVIASTIEEYSGDDRLRKMVNSSGYVNRELVKAGFDPLGEDEVKTLRC